MSDPDKNSDTPGTPDSPQSTAGTAASVPAPAPSSTPTVRLSNPSPASVDLGLLSQGMLKPSVQLPTGAPKRMVPLAIPIAVGVVVALAGIVTGVSLNGKLNEARGQYASETTAHKVTQGKASAAEALAHQQEVRAQSAETHAHDVEGKLAAANTAIKEKEDSIAQAAASAQALEGQIATSRQDFERERKRLEQELVAARARAKEATELADRLRTLVSGDEGDLATDDDQVTLQLVDSVMFRAGQADLTPAGEVVLSRLAEVLNSVPDKQVWVQGHTDVAPVPVAQRGRFPTNWELSAARALSVVHYLQDTAKIDPKRLAVVAFAQYRPVSRSASPRNRRIEIVLMPSVRVSHH